MSIVYVLDCFHIQSVFGQKLSIRCIVRSVDIISIVNNSYSLLISNRDEVLSRPSESLHHWDDEFGILAGKDLQFGGTWLGINRNGLIAALTNQIEISNKDSIESSSWDDKVRIPFASRGHLVHNCLGRNKPDHLSMQEMVDEAIEQLLSPIIPKYCRGFSLLVGHVQNTSISPNLKLLYHPSNQSHLPLHESWSKLDWEQPGQIYAISNGSPYEPDWPKVEKIKCLLKSSLDKIFSSESKTKYQGSFWREYFLKDILRDSIQADAREYPFKYLVHPEKINHMNLIFVPIKASPLHDGKEYGTISSTIVMAGYSEQGMNVQCIEYDWIKYRSICKQKNREFHILYDDIFPYIEQVHTMFIPT